MKLSLFKTLCLSLCFSSIACATPLHDAVDDGDIVEVACLIKQGANVNEKNKQEETPLHRAISKEHKRITQILLEAGADVTLQDHKGRTALHLAALTGNQNIIEILLNAKTPIFKDDVNGYSFFDYLILALGEKEALELLQKIHHNIFPEKTILFTSISNLSKKTFFTVLSIALPSYILPSYVECYRTQYSPQSPHYFHEEIMHHDKLNVAYKIWAIKQDKEEANFVNAPDCDGHASLYYAIMAEELEFINALIGIGANVNEQDNDGKSLLHHAINLGNIEIVELLVKAGADLNASNASLAQLKDNQKKQPSF